MPRLADPGLGDSLTVTETYDGGEALLDALRLLDVEFVFSSPGSEWAPVWEALARRGRDRADGPHYLDLWHETVAVGMATGYGLASRRLGAVLLHAGAGLLQGASAIHGAQLAGVPMLVCSSESMTYGEGGGPDPGSQWYRNLSVVGGPHVLVGGFTKWANQVGSRATLPGLVVRAGELAARSPAGPVYLNVPLEILLEEGPRIGSRPAARAGGKVSPSAEVREVAAQLAAARAPVVLTESAGRDPAAYTALLELCELLAIPVVEPQSAVCANFPRTSPLFQGGEFRPFAADADLVLLVDCRAPWYPPSNRPERASVVVVDAVPQRPHIVYQVLGADRYLEGDVGATLAALVEAVGKLPRDEELVAARRERLAGAHAARADALDEAEERAAGRTDGIDPVLLVRRLREAAPANAVVVDETITHSRILRDHLRGGAPDSYFYVQGGLGQGMAVALGVKLAARERPVVLAIGDGSFLYNPVVPALSASRDNELPLLVVVFNNREYLSMKLNHVRFYPEGAAVQTGDFRGVDLGTQPDLAELAAPFGMHGETVADPADLAAALRRGFDAVAGGATAIVNVIVSK
jgi:thiamine pyrophosphate-dependent acetolactate synthase large subunit-like protein